MAGVYVLAALFSSPYIAAKALAILAPVVIAIALRGTLAARGRPGAALGIVLVLAAAGSSFLVLRHAPVGPDSHASAARVRARSSAGEPVLFLGRDDFIGWELRGSGEITGIVTNFYDVEDAAAAVQEGRGGGEKFDVDARLPADARQLPLHPRDDRRAALGRAAAVSARSKRTDDYVLYEKHRPHRQAPNARRGHRPGRRSDCDTPATGRDRARARRSSGT